MGVEAIAVAGRVEGGIGRAHAGSAGAACREEEEREKASAHRVRMTNRWAGGNGERTIRRERSRWPIAAHGAGAFGRAHRWHAPCTMRATMKTISMLASMAVAGLALPGCLFPYCTDEARVSVHVTAVDEAGAPIAIERIVYTVDGEGPFEVDCPDSGVDGAYCSAESNQASIGLERAGTFVITLHHGNATGSAEVVVPTVECGHVDTQAVTITLEGAP